MTGPICAAATFLQADGPAQVPFRPCCAAAILNAARALESITPPCPRRLEPALPGDSLSGDSLFVLTPEPVTR
jgi:hypothetical protein